ncbi:hypothetical protein GGH19_002877 [Coemansia sp. RSA 1807]|nr:hypothetical protein GGH17_000534 [Coemansia sp. RSA 788]KAJ2145208.1 hypothetical protein IW142_002738 [Coemansia sp. RSA 564]KAJ2168295.1 hypothetical protein GGH15_001512 [Coemansia sp. RSA 562]KAJ2176197.1 hypothetical protein GGH16_000221 [Coemansia sp. RSA 560]KAJ2190981.1 hypothetical protein EV181_000661 [Coemansia sp. RSA 532]KAJ2199443.1 hypothetical protein GGH18_000511 [Coemansia sp. RSA 530]KAJ2200745.1 hypothetical protein IW144_000891 [Coemansia sp. RSA 522]KAJ2208722.1 hyp
MSYSAQNFVLFDSMGEGDAMAQSAVAQHQLAAMVDGHNAQAYFLGTPMLGSNGSMYGMPSLMTETTGSATAAAAATGGAMGSEGRRRSPTHGRTGSGVDHAQRRATHNAIERARRESLNGQFQDLASAVPALIHVRRPSKATIVEKSLDYIHTFKGHLSNRDAYIRKLQLRNQALHDEVSHLRSQLGLEPLSEVCEAATSGNEEEELEEAGSSTSPTQHASSLSANEAMVSTPAAEPQRVQLQQKRRQQSLDLGHQSAGRPALRVHIAAKSSDGHESSVSATSSRSSPLLHGSPLSAPLLSHMPQLPNMDVCQQQQHQQFAAAFVAGHSLQTIPPMSAAAQLGAMNLGMNLSSSMMPGTSMTGFMPQGGVIDMSKLTEVFASAASMPPASAVMSLATDFAEMPAPQFG